MKDARGNPCSTQDLLIYVQIAREAMMKPGTPGKIKLNNFLITDNCDG